MLLLYPRNYRALIEDPLAEKSPPVKYIGSTKKLAFYYYPKDRVNLGLTRQLRKKLGLK